MMRYKEVVFWLGCKHPMAIASDHVRHGTGPEPMNRVLMKGYDACLFLLHAIEQSKLLRVSN